MVANAFKHNRRDESHGVAKAGKSLSTYFTESDATSAAKITSKPSKTKLAARALTPTLRVNFADTADTNNRSEESTVPYSKQQVTPSIFLKKIILKV